MQGAATGNPCKAGCLLATEAHAKAEPQIAAFDLHSDVFFPLGNLLEIGALLSREIEFGVAPIQLLRIVQPTSRSTSSVRPCMLGFMLAANSKFRIPPRRHYSTKRLHLNHKNSEPFNPRPPAATPEHEPKRLSLAFRPGSECFAQARECGEPGQHFSASASLGASLPFSFP